MRTLFWFTNDLRLDDNPALAEAAAGASELICTYCHDISLADTDAYGNYRLGVSRKHFLIECLEQLSTNLQRQSQQLLQLTGRPEDTLAKLIDEHAIERVVRSRSFGLYENQHWSKLKATFPRLVFSEIDTYTLFTFQQVASIGELPPTFSKFRRLAEKQLAVQPTQKPISLPAPPAALKTSQLTDYQPQTKLLFRGGENAANEHVDSYFSSQSPSDYKQTRNELSGWSNSSKMSPWLATGSLSVRRLYQRIKQFEQHNGANESTYWLFFELLWREYFQWYALLHGRKLFYGRGITEQEADLPFDANRFEAWCRGDTSWPLVNACMNQLNQTGYMSNRGRQIVASVLIHELGLDWRSGAGYFEQQLVDYDVASNWGNWQYIAGVGADPRGGRHFSIEKQIKQYDPDGQFVTHWATK